MVSPVSPSIPAISTLSLPDICRDVGDGDGDIGLEWIADESVLLLLLQGLIAVLVGLLSDHIFRDGGIDEMLASAGDPSQVDDELSMRSSTKI